MIVVSWNIRGLDRLEKRLAVRKLVRKHKVDVLILQETKVSRNADHIVPDVRGSEELWLRLDAFQWCVRRSYCHLG